MAPTPRHCRVAVHVVTDEIGYRFPLRTKRVPCELEYCELASSNLLSASARITKDHVRVSAYVPDDPMKHAAHPKPPDDNVRPYLEAE